MPSESSQAGNLRDSLLEDESAACEDDGAVPEEVSISSVVTRIVIAFVLGAAFFAILGWFSGHAAPCCILFLITVLVTCVIGLPRLLRSHIKHVAKAAEWFLNVEVQIGDVQLDLWKGALTIKQLTLGNPEGYKSEYLLRADHILLVLKVRAVILSLSRQIQADVLEVKGVDALVEVKGNVTKGKTNMEAFGKNIGKVRPSTRQAIKAEDAEMNPQAKAKTKASPKAKMNPQAKAKTKAAPKAKNMQLVQAVFDHFHVVHQDHTFHFPPAWGGEFKRNIQFYAYTKQHPGTEPVYGFYNSWNRDHTVHFGDAWKGETKGNVLFYAFKEQVPGTEPVYRFWNKFLTNSTFHFGQPWGGEERLKVQFYAHRYHPTWGKPKEFILKKVSIKDLRVRVVTNLANAKAHTGTLHYDDFSDKFAARKLEDVIFVLVKELVKKVKSFKLAG